MLILDNKGMCKKEEKSKREYKIKKLYVIMQVYEIRLFEMKVRKCTHGKASSDTP